MNASATTATDYLTASADEMLSLDEQEFEVPALNEDFDEKVQQAQEQLLKLRHQQEAIEKQKTELEELGQQQDQFLEGRSRLRERLNHSVSTLEREALEAEKRAEEFLQTKDTFVRHLDRIQAFNPEMWSRSDLRGELARALAAIEDAESDYQNSMSRIAGLLERNSPAGAIEASEVTAHAHGNRSFKQWFLSGLAFTLPLMAFALLALVLFFLLG